ncbi:response regulator receiver modulated diguanylate cyclase [Halothece sp. PCC 7418]|uniref:GGDEF domain-containing response regulator n=1 Tax=Halothece sp. (strain PCC 7418) TaxID=65093 RepID=UPI0002A070A1|nr:PleD family two-component system response regulator [Halothece sp. PCC 7418]AFZ45337.1 response regulator receiver modulated diguanylate cyclase [Halothece sp. PCC 7418]
MLEPDFQTHPPRILVVEDEKTLRLISKRALTREGYTVREAINGEEALELVVESVPDLVLLDAMMPEMDGFTCCAELQKRLGKNCPPVLMVTVLDDEKSVNLAFEVGATEYITKPINWAVLRKRIDRLLTTRWALQELERRYEQAHQLSLELEKANQKLEYLARVDALTQVANRRTFNERFQEEWNRSRRDSSPISLILCDVDYFKKYNDYYGHQAGDSCLYKIAKILQENCQRASDLVARYGGEEFAIILGGIHLEEATHLAEKIRLHVQESAIPHQANPNGNSVTLSLGVASLIPDENYSKNDLVRQADAALYEAKNAGRDRVVVYQG